MLRFNFVYSNLLSIPQYISIHLMLRFNYFAFLKMAQFRYFNTSYVTVQLPYDVLIPISKVYFNTSYVTVQHRWHSDYTHCCSISIHLMLRFNNLSKSSTGIRKDFNTSYVTVQRREPDFIKKYEIFQYILCYGSTLT